MLRITTHIERLLAIHDCVIIPRWGGFVLQTVSAAYREEEHAFVPMRKEVVFNVALQHSDGLLTTSYMQAYEVDFRKAQSMIDSDVEEMTASLARFGKLSFGSIGTFSSGEAGQPIFQPGKADIFDADQYGLELFYFPLLPVATSDQEHTIGKPKSKADIFYIPVNRRLVRGLIASAAAVALFLLISTPVKEVNHAAYTASFIPTERVIADPATLQPTYATETPAVAAETVVEDTSIADTAIEPVATAKKKMYYIVIGSFPSEPLANVYISGVSQDDFNQIATVERDGKYRVYTDAFENRDEAEMQLSLVRLNERYQNAWLFISR